MRQKWPTIQKIQNCLLSPKMSNTPFNCRNGLFLNIFACVNHNLYFAMFLRHQHVFAQKINKKCTKKCFYDFWKFSRGHICGYKVHKFLPRQKWRSSKLLYYQKKFCANIPKIDRKKCKSGPSPKNIRNGGGNSYWQSILGVFYYAIFLINLSFGIPFLKRR